MKRALTVISLLLSSALLILTSCTKDSTGPSETASEFIGVWASDSNTATWKEYVEFATGGDYFYYGSDELNWHTIDQGIYWISGATIVIDELPIQYIIQDNGNSLVLTYQGESIGFHREENPPDFTNWVRDLSVVSQIELPYDLGYWPDITSDGSNFWVMRGEFWNTQAMQMNSEGDSLTSIFLMTYTGIEYQGGLLWTLREDPTQPFSGNYQLAGINPSTGQAEDSLNISSAVPLDFNSAYIARTSDAFFLNDLFGDEIIKVNATDGVVSGHFPFEYVGGLTSVDGKLMAHYMWSIVEIDPETGLIAETYSIPFDEMMTTFPTSMDFNGLAWDGTYFYTLNDNYSSDTFSLVKISIGD